MDITGLSAAMWAKGYDLDIWLTNYPFAIFGSRAAGCHQPNSDWDVVVLGSQPTADRGKGLDFLVEDPPNDPYWYHRDLAFHLSGYAVWLSGAPNWDPSKLQWEAAYARKLKRVRELALSLGHFGPTLTRSLRRYWMRKCLCEAGRALLLGRRCPISPTPLLPQIGPAELKALGVSSQFIERFDDLSRP